MVIPYQFWNKLPRLFFALVFLVGFFLVNLCMFHRLENPTLLMLLAVPLNSLTYYIVAEYGLNDGFVAGVIGISFYLRLVKKRFILAGIFMGLGALMKFYPLLVLPFFCLEDTRKFRYDVFFSAILTFVSGYMCSFVIGAENVFDSLFKNHLLLEAKLLSVLYSIDFRFDSALLNYLIDKNAVLLLVSLALCFRLTIKYSMPWYLSSLFSYVVILVFYKIGNQQYWLGLMMLIQCVGLVDHTRNYMKLYLPAVIFISIFQIGYQVLGSYWSEYFFIRKNIGYVSYIILSVLLILSFYEWRRNGFLDKREKARSLGP
jgi:ABC-type multidrug transport system fused ATPase/permease subunit